MTDQPKTPTQAATEQFTKLLDAFKIPGVDMTAVLESQQKNIEALAKATQIATEGAAAVSQRQVEIMQATVEQVSTVLKELKVSGDAQTEVVREAVETALANAQQLAEMVSKANAEAFEVIKTRMRESVEEIRRSATGGAPR
jgi:phasin family protein